MEESEKAISHTLLFHPQRDVLGDVGRGSEEVKHKLSLHMALIDTTVVVGDISDTNGEILQVVAPIPL